MNQFRKYLPWALLVSVIVYALFGARPAQAQLLPVWTAVGEPEKTFGEGSYDFRNTGNGPDYWFPGHKRNTDGAYAKNADGTYASTRSFLLTERDSTGDGTDRHECGYADLDADGRVDMICVNGADRGTGTGETELYRNVSTATEIRFEMKNPTTSGLNAGDAPYGRKRTATFFKQANGKIGVWIVTQGEKRSDGKPNINRIYEYNGNWTWTEIPDPLINMEHASTCTRSADLNSDGRDDLLLCRDAEWNSAGTQDSAGSIIYYQNTDGSFRRNFLDQIALSGKRWKTARLVDYNNDGRVDIVASVTDLKRPRIVIHKQLVTGEIKASPDVTMALFSVSNSLGIADLNGDGVLDYYATQSPFTACMRQGMTDPEPDIVWMSSGTTRVKMTVDNEPQANGCSWMVTPVGGRRVHLSRGYEGFPGQGHMIQF